MPVNNALTPEGQNSLGAAFGYFPQLRRNRTVQDPRLAAEMPLQFLRGRTAATLGAPSDILNFLRSPLPMEVAGDVDYAQQAQVPYGLQELLRTLPLPPQGTAQAAAANVGAVVPLSPIEALQAARAARQAAFATGKALGPAAERMAADYLQRQGLMAGVLPASSKQFNVVNRDASEIFGAGAEKFRYTDPASNGSIEVLKRPDNTASVLSLEVPESFRGKGIGESLQAKVMQDFPQMQGQVSSKAAAKTAYRLGRRPPGQPNASLDEVYKIMDENSSINLVSPQMQRSFNSSFQYPQEEALRLAQQRAALPVEQYGLGLPAGNTAAQRDAAMSGRKQFHFSRTGGDYQSLDSGQYAQAPFDAVGTHVGSKEAAMDRFRNTTATTDQIKGATYPVSILGDRPLMNKAGMPWGEDELNAFLRKSGEYNSPDAKMTYPQMNAELRKKLFEEQGYTSIPYINEVEGKGSVSYIVPPENIRSINAAFDPFRRNAAIAAATGAIAPDLLAAQAEQDAYSRNELRKFKRQSQR